MRALHRALAGELHAAHPRDGTIASAVGNVDTGRATAWHWSGDAGVAAAGARTSDPGAPPADGAASGIRCVATSTVWRRRRGRQARRPRGRGRVCTGSAMLAWRDLDDPEAGGSELHASTVAALWAEAGIEVTMRTSYAAGHPQVSWRDGYRVIRKAGRYLVFPRAAFSEMMGWHGGSDGLVEIWNGMPFFSPLWARTPARHVAAPRARRDVGDDAAAAARGVRPHRSSRGSRRRSTAARRSSRCRTRRSDELVARPQLQARPRHVVPPGIDPRFSPGRREVADAARRRGRSAGAGEAVRRARSTRWSRLQAAPPRPRGGDRRRGLPSATSSRRRSTRPAPSAGSRCPGRVDDDELVDLYRRGVGARERVGARGLGHDAHRGRRVRHARGRHPHRRPRRRGRRRAQSGLLADAPRRARAARSTACSSDRDAARRGCRRVRSSTRRSSRGRRPREARSRCSPPRRCADAAARDGTRRAADRRAAESGEARELGGAAHAGSGYLALALLGVRPAAADRRRARSRPTPSSTSTSTRRGCSSAAWSMWDPNIGMGTVTHQNIGYLFPMGPFYWVLDALGVPDWVAQRLWLGSILFVAGARDAVPAAHARRARPGRGRRRARVHAHAVHARLRGADLGDPAAVGRRCRGCSRSLIRRRSREGGWRYPALFALVVQVDRRRERDRAGLRGHRPVLWIVVRDAGRRARSTGGARSARSSRIGVLTLVASLWWIAGLWAQGAYGLDILKYTETLEAVVAHVAAERGAARPRLLVLLRPGQLGPWIEAEPGLHAAPGR